VQDLANKSPHPIRIAGIEYQPKLERMIVTEGGPALLFVNGEQLHRLVGRSLQRPQKTRTSTPTAEAASSNNGAIHVVWSDFMVAIGYIIFGFVAMFAGIASLFVEEDCR
jgi:ABC-type multidrug transport system permease subunit